MRHIVWFGVSALFLATSASAQTAQPSLVALDLDGGYVSAVHDTDSTRPDLSGWKSGATLRLGTLPFGIAGEVARSAGGDVRVWDIAAGPRLTSPYLKDLFGRGFVHGLAGVSHASDPGRSNSGFLTIAGAGIEFAVFARITADYVLRSELQTARHDARLTLGGVVPICFRGCDAWQGIRVRRGTRQNGNGRGSVLFK